MPWVLFFDGDCGLCNQSIRRLVKWDDQGLIHYAPLQGQMASEHGFGQYLEGENASMVLLDQESGKVFTQGDCLLQILRLLGGFWRLMLLFGVLPRAMRNWLYRLVARNRRRILKGQTPVCELPDERLRSRLLE